MSNSVLIQKLNSTINSQMCSFLDTIAEKYGMTAENLKSDWSAFSGLKPKAPKPTGPKLSDLKIKCKELDIPSTGTKTILQDRIAAFERGEIQTITARREEKKAKLAEAKAMKTESEDKVKSKKKSKSSKSSTKSTSSTSSSKSTESVKSLKEKLKSADLPCTGNKATLEKRLTDYQESVKSGKVNYNNWKIGKIRSELKDRKIKVKPGTKKEDMITLLKSDDNGASKKKKALVDYDSESESELDSDDCSGCSDNECDGCGSDSDCSDCDSDSDDEQENDGNKWIKHSDGHWGPKDE